MSETRENIEIDLRRILLVLWHRSWIILLVAILTASIGFGYAWFFITPTYSSSIQLYVNNNYENSPGFSSSQLTASQQLADTYMVIMRSRNVLEEVAKEAKLGYTYSQLKSMISASAVQETEVFQVTVTCEDPAHAEIIANAMAKVLPGKIKEIVKASDAEVVDYAVENRNPVGPSYKKYTLVGAVVGAVLVVGIIAVLEIIDTTINSEEYLTHVYKEYPLLAVIPGAKSSKSGYYKGSYESEKKPTPEKKSGGAKK
jgi:capsular polysaccharide biosynthesis protein